ncbi:pyruvate kinase [Helicobacter sp. 14348-15]|uniref:pyruvate kinase n=1 Tax=Helicobacter colisuis TaxID=2949739 RepID=UPI002029E7AF|nr:pyruvate kinase [Helicobacter colisuis]MCL9821311.1 pyruvate kinase [Helicobacter colisuis]MCL9822718.1 pyruvate kinase [Helicobacter colisuis]
MQKFILTVGPSLGGRVPINDIHQSNFIYRINGAHGSVQDIEETIVSLKKQNQNIEILIDLPGNKIRTSNLANPISLKKGKDFVLKSDQFNYGNFISLVKPGMEVYANDSCFLFVVKEVRDNEIVFTSNSEGLLLNNKGMHIRNLHKDIPFLFEKDFALIKLCNQFNIPYIGASFVRKRDDICILKEKVGYDTQVIAKIETLEAVNNLNDILEVVNFILIDRGDLSTEIGIEKIPRYQQHIIEKAHHKGVKVFLATQILKNMEKNPLPTIAEIDDLYTISKKGIYGVQLSEEIAIGEYVKQCIDVLLMMQNEIASEEILLK